MAHPSLANRNINRHRDHILYFGARSMRWSLCEALVHNSTKGKQIQKQTVPLIFPSLSLHAPERYLCINFQAAGE